MNLHAVLAKRHRAASQLAYAFERVLRERRTRAEEAKWRAREFQAASWIYFWRREDCPENWRACGFLLVPGDGGRASDVWGP